MPQTSDRLFDIDSRAATSHSGEPLRLPVADLMPRRQSVPILAAFVPVFGAVALWLFTGSIFALWFAALGPLIAGASALDAGRAARKQRRVARHTLSTAIAETSRLVDERHDRERKQLDSQHPDVIRFLADDTAVWRDRSSSAPDIVVGRGIMTSSVQVTGGEGAEADALRERARHLADAPVIVAGGGGIAVVGPQHLAAAVVRALVIQLCLAVPPTRLSVTSAKPADWTLALPHWNSGAARTLSVCEASVPLDGDCDILIACVEPGAPIPPGCACVVTLTGLTSARVDERAHSTAVTVEMLASAQALDIAGDLSTRACAFTADPGPPLVALGELLPRSAENVPVPLRVPIGHDGHMTTWIDLVADGPHAIVAGVTGSGKSELLITWITALCARFDTTSVSFLLVDFKGGTAFDALRALPHVAGVITDLDATGARRALKSLRAEVQWRERALGEVGAREIGDERATFPRLVIVVDEFAALVSAHPELHETFVDVAARGRALGMHLVLGTQRVAGVVRDSLLANCPLRMSLRVTDPADSKSVVGTDHAFRLAGTPEARGFAMIKRSGDALPSSTRIALTTGEDIARLAKTSRGPAPRRPWLPALPSDLDRSSLQTSPVMGDIVLGLADEPDQQRQCTATLKAEDRGLLVIGGGGSGKTSVLALIAEQSPSPRLVWVPREVEGAWDTLSSLVDDPPDGAIVLIDDLDSVLAQLPSEYALEAVHNLEHVLRAAGKYRVVVAAQRFTGAVSRVADLLPRRALLAMPSRQDYVAAGGDSATFSERRPPGRARLDGTLVQFARPRGMPGNSSASEPSVWRPTAPITGFVLRPGAAARRLSTSWTQAGCRVLSVEEANSLTSITDVGERALVIVGDGEQWQRSWRTLSAVRENHDFVVDAGCAAELRVLTGIRELPPYCKPGAQRAWLLSRGEQPRRVRMSKVDAGPGAQLAG
ncbi:S-DNA-T family DNA segregation ATPase FtsK/SpoIIIE [Microbacterium endophyticum]|uniref:S-DNA-T family DNA segregation ATPase FtsK/SpoIIIE n=1 Tax=Microbacterium endophyticum TaxID=1526412 RepID=A0A7W4V4E6_9MICO|nr:FtsK/SpoIIIE domain-containing protein [Microbacterium endophyticum]MBB2975993.1 S-DNA-T family DNA segregation ATPase FtsK/SpoIIIE [Microbacterium endophyticum]NIK35088.1 S-DNA-T family DNA segregation ATPase FtsK/SpoIIIE [Microbacterium endophyticum]